LMDKRMWITTGIMLAVVLLANMGLLWLAGAI
jgi:hypothetical protein